MKKDNKKKRSACYIIVDKKSNYFQGAFEFSKEGLILAKEYVKTLDDSPNKYKIIKK